MPPFRPKLFAKENLMKDVRLANPQPLTEQVAEVAQVSPFTPSELQGQTFARGNMLGGAVPIREGGLAPWQKKTPD